MGHLVVVVVLRVVVVARVVVDGGDGGEGRWVVVSSCDLHVVVGGGVVTGG